MAENLTAVDKLTTPHDRAATGVVELLERLDRRLAAAVHAAEAVFAARAAGDLYRGLVITPADVQAALARTPGEPFGLAGGSFADLRDATDSPSLRRLLVLQSSCGLSDLDLEILTMALAPEVDLRYERLYAYLQDDVSLRRPSVDLALNVLSPSAGEKLRNRSRFAVDAPLVRHRLIEVYTPPERTHSPVLAHAFRMDEQITRFLLLEDGLDSRLGGMCRVIEPEAGRDDRRLGADRLRQLAAMARIRSSSAMRLWFQGPPDCGQEQAVAYLASRLGLRILAADLTRMGREANDDVLRTLPREAWLQHCLLHIRGLHRFWSEGADVRLGTLWSALADVPIPYVVDIPVRWPHDSSRPPGLIEVPFEIPDTALREEYWRTCLSVLPHVDDGTSAASLARRYRLTFAQIQDSVREALATENEPHERIPVGRAAALARAARARTRGLLSGLAVHIEPRVSWPDLVVPEDVAAQLGELCGHFLQREAVLDQWGFRQKAGYGTGINALFAGPSGTGKTMASEVVAAALGLDLYRIDLASVVSKYIGETEKNLETIFSAAENANAILLFDEADSLFGKRSEVRDSHDRYANLEISYLLQRMERFDGIAILATNLRENLDEAFVRRLTFVVNFPFPDEILRRRLWRNVWPSRVCLADDLDLDWLAEQLKLSGGNIASIARAAAFAAMSEGMTISRHHVLHATQREFQKMGKSVPTIISKGESS